MFTPELILSMLNLLVVYAESVIGLRIILKLMGANVGAPFVSWVYQSSRPLLSPFEGMFPSSKLDGVPFTIEFSAIFALFAYFFLGYIFQEIIDFISINVVSKRNRRTSVKKNNIDEN